MTGRFFPQSFTGKNTQQNLSWAMSQITLTHGLKDWPKDRLQPVFCRQPNQCGLVVVGSVAGCPIFENVWTGPVHSCPCWGPKNQTRPDFQTLTVVKWQALYIYNYQDNPSHTTLQVKNCME